MLNPLTNRIIGYSNMKMESLTVTIVENSEHQERLAQKAVRVTRSLGHTAAINTVDQQTAKHMNSHGRPHVPNLRFKGMTYYRDFGIDEFIDLGRLEEYLSVIEK